jgi:putative transposase
MSPRQLRRVWLGDLVTQIWEESRRTYGARRVRAELGDAHGQVVNLKLVRALMREQGISGLPARRRYKRSDSNRYTSTDLVNRSFGRDGPNQLWMTDIERHEALSNLAVVKGHRLPFVAADGLKLRAA